MCSAVSHASETVEPDRPRGRRRREVRSGRSQDACATVPPIPSRSCQLRQTSPRRSADVDETRDAGRDERVDARPWDCRRRRPARSRAGADVLANARYSASALQSTTRSAGLGQRVTWTMSKPAQPKKLRQKFARAFRIFRSPLLEQQHGGARPVARRARSASEARSNGAARRQPSAYGRPRVERVQVGIVVGADEDAAAGGDGLLALRATRGNRRVERAGRAEGRVSAGRSTSWKSVQASRPSASVSAST